MPNSLKGPVNVLTQGVGVVAVQDREVAPTAGTLSVRAGRVTPNLPSLVLSSAGTFELMPLPPSHLERKHYIVRFACSWE
jgi:hypothetical protein